MMKTSPIVFFLFLLLAVTFRVQAQPWMNAVKKQDANFYEIQKAFNDYWANKTPEKGKGYKQFKRWEWFWQQRVYPSGNFPKASFEFEEWQRYVNAHPQYRRQSNSLGQDLTTMAPTPTGTWSPLGPATSNGGYSGVGRLNCITFHPTDVNTFWVGAAAGGLWKTTNGGSSWSTLTDDLPVLGVSGLAVDYTNPNVMYLGTGDGDHYDTRGVGVLKSTNGGITWNPTGLSWTVQQGIVVRALVMHPSNPAILLVATSDGIYKTTNGGTSWTKVQIGNYSELKLKPGDPTVMYAASAGMGNTQVWRSTNTGDTWTATTSFSGLNRIALAVTPANPSVVGALCSSSATSGFAGYYTSVNSGASFELKYAPGGFNLLGYNVNGSDGGGQGWYDLCLTISPTDANVVHAGGVNIWKSTNGGSNWAINTMWYGGTGVPEVHADKHYMAYHPLNASLLFSCNDGGLYKTANGGASWQDLSNGLQITQFYRLGASATNSNVLIGGTQDNGTKIKNGNAWTDVIGGDGMECLVDYTNANIMYGTLYYGDLFRSTDAGANFTRITPAGQSGGWVTPFIIDPVNPQTLYIGYRDIYKTTDRGNNWTRLSTNLSTSDLQALAVAPSNTQTIYAATYATLYRSTNGGSTWSGLSLPSSNTPTSLAVHPTDPQTIWITFSGYSAGTKVYKSINGGASWTNISGTLPNLPVNTIVYQNGSSDVLYIGTDAGVFVRNATMSDWQAFDTGLPNVVVTELEIQYAAAKIRAATFGRSMWESDLFSGFSGPTGLLATSSSANRIDLTWADNASNETGYVLERSVGGPGNFTVLANLPANTTTYANTGLTSGTNYCYRVKAINGATSSSYSNEACASPGDIVMSGTPVTTCTGTYYDPGYLSDYFDNANLIQTLTPTTAGAKVRAVFTAFSTEAGYDYLRIYDGPNTSSPLIGTYHGTNGPGTVTATNASGQLTFQFTSDGSVVSAGWRATLSCTGVSNPTIVSFAPASAPVGAAVAIRGTNFASPVTVRFNGVAATNISLESASLVVATIPAGATSGPIQVVSNGTTATSASNLTIGPVTSIWQAKTGVPTARGQHGAIPLTSNGKVYLFGGTTTGSDILNSMQVYTTNDFAWAAGAPMPAASRGFAYAIGSDKLIYVFGGYGTTDYVNQSFRLTPLTNTWTALANMPTPVWEGAATATNDGKIYVFGGQASGGLTNLTQVYTIATNTWSTAAPMPVALMQHRAVTGYDGKIYVFGGRTSSSGGLSDVVRIYNPASNTWSTGAPMPIAKNQFGTFRNNDGRIFIIGGKASYFNNTGPFFHTVEIYTPSSNSWASGPALIQPVGEMVTMNSIGNVFLMGGATGTYRNFNWRLVLPPVAPSNLVATAVSASQINLTYNDNSGNENRFELERASSAAGPWSVFHTNSPNHPFYNHTGLTANTTIYYRVRACNSAGCSPYSNVTSATTFSTSAAARESVEPELKLSLQASPNPFNQKVVLHFTVEKTQEAKLEIYDLKGVLVERLFEGEAEAGRDYQVVWNAALLKSGFFIGRLASGDKSVNQKLILQR